MPAIVANNTNAYKLWKAGLIASTNAVDFNSNILETIDLNNLAPFRDAAGNPSASFTPAERDALKASATATVNGLKASTAGILNNVALKGGFNAIRVFIDLTADEITYLVQSSDGWNDKTYDRNDPMRLHQFYLVAKQIDNLLNICGKLGMGLILCPGQYYSLGAPLDRLWNTKSYQDNFIKFWKMTAQRWAKHPALIAFELVNEPGPLTQAEDLNHPTVNNPRPTYTELRTNPGGGIYCFKALMEQAILAIRAHDTVTPVMVSVPNDAELDFYFDEVGSTKGGNLIKDPSKLVVYTLHTYSPNAFCNQGIGGNYHTIGTGYPGIKGVVQKRVRGEPQSIKNPGGWWETVVDETDFSARKGMAKVYMNARKLKETYGQPVFLGEFSANSASYLRAQALDPESPFGASDDNKPTESQRAIYGLYYIAGTDTGYIALSSSIDIYDKTIDPADGQWKAYNKVDLVLKGLPGKNLGIFEGLEIKDAVLKGARGGDEEFLIYFKWPTSPILDTSPPPPAAPSSLAHAGSTKYYPVGSSSPLTPSDAFPLVDINTGALRTPDELRKTFSNLPDGGMNYGTDANPIFAPKPEAIGYFTIIPSIEAVKKQEAARVTYVTDVLRECAAIGMSWSWFGETDVKNYYIWNNKFWQVDNIPNTATDTGGKLRALLKRAAHQSYE